MFVISTLRITGLRYTYGFATLSAAYLCLEDHLVALDLKGFNFNCSLTWLTPPSESLGYTTYMGVQL